MARPRGTRNIKGWTMTPQQQVEAGLLSSADVVANEVIQSDGVRVIRVETIAGATLNESRLDSLPSPDSTKKSLGLRRSLAQVENDIRRNSYETGVYLDDNGKVLLRITQNKGTIDFVEAERAIARGKIFTHNHPEEKGMKATERAIGVSLSKEDLVFAAVHIPKETRAVAHTGTTYSLKLNKPVPGTDERSRWEWVNKTYDKAWEAAVEKVGRRFDSGKLTRDEIASLSNHFVNKEFARLSGGVFSYNVKANGKIQKEIRRYDALYEKD